MKEWNHPDFMEVAKYLVMNGVKMPMLEKIGLFHPGEDKLFLKFVRENRIPTMRGRQATSISLKDKTTRRHLLTALSLYNRVDLAYAAKTNQLPRALVQAYQKFALIHNIEANDTKLTLERFIIAATSEEYSNINIETCSKCTGKYIRSSFESTKVYGCIDCEERRTPLFTGLAQKKAA
ncbi:FlhC family transcriptional regulator [Comamonas thiooxydans]|uniref:FlhC family transcriptional regulator n=1 Tax=Comamonas thiooxydans TaxID=363952 RepID=UPI0013F48F8E|nr:FlhC family transcriptional regulator [Comamonas thiooxydans]